MNAMKNKIKSQRGASITFALLLFLVCSVVSIVVVVAGSAAAGRMSQRAETDQRYYAVTSAVELLCDDFKDMTATVEYTKPVAASDVALDDIIVTSITAKDGSSKNLSNYAITAAASKALVNKIVNIVTPTTDPDDTLNLTATSAPTGAAVDCTIKEYVKKDGRVILEVSNTVAAEAEAANKNVYTLQAVFDARISQSTSQYTVNGSGGPVKMEKGTLRLEWSVIGIEKGVYVGT